MTEQETLNYLEAIKDSAPTGNTPESFNPNAMPDLVNLVSDSILFYAALAFVLGAVFLCVRNKPHSLQRALVLVLAGIALGILLIGKNW